MFGDDEIAQYKTGPWPDNNLEDTLWSSQGQFLHLIIEQPSALMTILVQWVVPILLFVAVGQFMGKQPQKRMGGPNAMTLANPMPRSTRNLRLARHLRMWQEKRKRKMR